MKFELAAERRNTIVNGSQDEFRLVLQAVRAQQFRLAIDRRSELHGGTGGDFAAIVPKLVAVQEQAEDPSAVEHTVVFDFDEMRTIQTSLANAADAVRYDEALYGRNEPEAHELALAYDGLAQHWAKPAHAAVERAIRG